MADIALRLNRSLAKDLSSSFLPNAVDEISLIEIIIRLEEHSLNVREFGAFLTVIDSVYGRIAQSSFVRYSHTTYRQISIAEIRKGSTELVIADAISRIIDATPYVVLLLFIRYLGIGIKGLSEVTKNFADSYKSAHEGRLAKVNRKKIISDMEKDEALQNLTPTQRTQLINLLAKLEAAEKKRLPAARRFVRKSLKDVKLSRKRFE